MNRNDLDNHQVHDFSRSTDDLSVSGNQDEMRGATHQVHQSARRRSRILIVISYCCMVVMEIALFLSAALASVSITIGDQKSVVDYAGSYTVVQLQQKDIVQRVEQLAETYHFNASDISDEISAAGISQYSQKTVEYWFGLLYGRQNQTKPAWDTGGFSAAIQEGSLFQSSWTASEQNDKAEEAAQAIGQSIAEAVFPIEPLPLTLGLLYVSNQQYISHISLAAWILLILAIVMAVVIRLMQNTRPFQSFWFFGVSAITGFLALSVLDALLQNQQIDGAAMFHNSVLAFYVSSIMTLLEVYVRSFSLGLFLAGAILLICFFMLRYKRLHNTHHELFSFF